ncbi:MAG: polysaccharide deacetylase family protein, partial [Armatimonadota bacterium]
NSAPRVLIIALSLAFAVSCACAGAPAGYIACVSEALDALGRGTTLESAQLLQETLAKNPDSPLGHVALGYALLLGGRTDEAEAHFEAASAGDGKCALAAYGRGLVWLKRSRLEEALPCFSLAHQLEPERGVKATIEYIKAIAGTEPPSWDLQPGDQQQASESEDEAVLALAAVRLMNERKYAEALPIWSKLQAGAVRPGFGERIGCSMTFLKSSPVATTGWPMNKPLKSAVGPARAVKTVKGTVQLRADISRARNVRMVTFLVDDRLIGVTNRQPFDCAWDTTRWTNGPHTVKIIGTDDLGATVNEKATQVIVRNPPRAENHPVPDDDTCGLWDRLWEQMRLKPSAAAINYNLAICAQQTGDLEAAKAALERVMAADPGYPGAAERLSRLSGPTAETGTLYRIQTRGKIVALTFDDGPKPETAALLDVLKASGVKATFFVVGKQAERHPELLRRICDEGHQIGNHSYSHSALEYLSAREIEREIFRCAAVVRSITGRSTRLLRPPGAHGGKKVAQVAGRFGMKTVLYSANCTKVEDTTSDKVFRYVVASAQPGAVILMHNLDRVALRALPQIIDHLKARGYEFVTL